MWPYSNPINKRRYETMMHNEGKGQEKVVSGIFLQSSLCSQFHHFATLNATGESTTSVGWVI